MVRSGLIFLPLSLLLLHFLSLQLLSSAYNPPDKYFIACGSKSNTTISDGRIFVGDLNSPFAISPGRSKPVVDRNRSNDKSFLYQTARVFENSSLYELQVEQSGIYMVRLHFYAFSSPINLSDAVFDVSASGISLLSDFRVRKLTTLSIKEFLLTIKIGKFGLVFKPSQNTSFAFVNAIEVFPVPENFLPDSAPRVTSSGLNGRYSQVYVQILLSSVFRTVHRINVGGPKITPENDTLWRTWLPDDVYLLNPEAAKNSQFYNASLNPMPEGATNYSAPDYVYQTAKELNLNSNFSNVSWAFPVSEYVMKHLVRVHFCDIISVSLNVLVFNLFIYNKFRRTIDPYEEVDKLSAPFYFDFVVDSNGYGFINISIVASPDSLEQNAFLNGVEIFEISRNSGSDLPLESQPKKNFGLLIRLGVAFGVIIGILISVSVVFKCGKEKLEKTYGELRYGGMSSPKRLAQRNGVIPIAPNLNLSLKITFADIQRATSNFNKKMLIGEGGFGKVYKGTLKGIKIAVKRSQPGHGQGLSEFHTEILVLSQIRHRHLVSLIGYCDEKSEMILVYEFMENRTLRDHLYDLKRESQGSSTKFSLSWEKRLEICIGAAKGLHYLHSGSDKGIIHRDVKSTNILLDENFVAKVADFGLSKSGIPDPNNESMVFKGSFGYLDPEYIISSQYTVKSDVYSFGVVLFEVLCARPAIFSLPQKEETVSLAKWAMDWHRKSQLEDIIDPFLEGKISPDSLRVMGKMAEKCLKENGLERPTMDEVEWNLKYALQLQKNATQRQPHEDTNTNALLESAFPILHRMPSNAFPVGEDDASIDGNFYSNTFSS